LIKRKEKRRIEKKRKERKRKKRKKRKERKQDWRRPVSRLLQAVYKTIMKLLKLLKHKKLNFN
jgi:hypothetical protein